MARGRWTLLFVVGFGVCPLMAPGVPPSRFAATADKRPERTEPPPALAFPPAPARTVPPRSAALDPSPGVKRPSPALIPSRSTISAAPLVRVPSPSFVAPAAVAIATSVFRAPFAPVAPAPFAPSAPFTPSAPDTRAALRAASRPPALVPLYASFATLQGLDYASTRSALENGAHEANPLMRSIVKNPPAFIAVKAAATAGVIVAGEKIWKKNRVGAVLFVAGANAAMAIVVGSNYSVR